jgi:hypothetical protein
MRLQRNAETPKRRKKSITSSSQSLLAFWLVGVLAFACAANQPAQERINDGAQVEPAPKPDDRGAQNSPAANELTPEVHSAVAEGLDYL